LLSRSFRGFYVLHIVGKCCKGLALATQALETLRQGHVILPAIPVIERACAAAITRANRRIYRSLVTPLTKYHQQRLDNLLKVKPDTKITWLMWLRQSSLRPNSRYMLERIERLKLFQALLLPEDLGKNIHQNRLLKMAREGRQMTPQDLSRLETDRRYATLAAMALERMATITDEIIDLHDRILIKIFRTAKNQHQQRFQKQGMEIKEKVQLYSKIGHALLNAKESGADPYAAIESVIPWEEFAQSILETDQLGQPKSFDHFYLVSEKFSMLRRYTPAFLNVLKLRNAPAAKGVLDAIEVLRSMNDNSARKVPVDAPTAFIKPRWKSLVVTEEGIDRRFYEICALTELKNLLRSGDIWVQGSRQFRDFDDYLLPPKQFEALKETQELPIAVNIDCDQYLDERLKRLEQQLAKVNHLALANELPGAIGDQCWRARLDLCTGWSFTP
jgi:hypothetical protein